MAANGAYFDWTNRPKNVKKFINEAFTSISSREIFDKSWTYNGDSAH